jgi:hypothetical protein
MASCYGLRRIADCIHHFYMFNQLSPVQGGGINAGTAVRTSTTCEVAGIHDRGGHHAGAGNRGERCRVQCDGSRT